MPADARCWEVRVVTESRRAPLAAWIPLTIVVGLVTLLVIGWLIYR